MADIIPPGFAEVIVPFSHASLARKALVTFGIGLNDVATVTMANSIMTVFGGQWDDTIDTNVLMGPVTLRVGQDGGENLVIVGSTTVVGIAARSDSINPSNAALVHKHTSRGGRRGRGRMYIPWSCADSDVDEVGIIGTAQRTALGNIANSFLIALGTVTGVDDMVLLHSEGQSTPGAPNVVTDLSIDARVGVQRRRLGR